MREDESARAAEKRRRRRAYGVWWQISHRHPGWERLLQEAKESGCQTVDGVTIIR
jgi:hypothetical protein